MGIPHHRRSIRLEGYDYTQDGGYFITLVTAGRSGWFGDIRDGEMQLNPAGQMIRREWQRLPHRFPGLEIDAFMVMPNHFHAIVILCPPDDRLHMPPVGVQRNDPTPIPSTPTLRPRVDNPPLNVKKDEYSPYVVPGSLGAIIRAFKSSTTLLFHRMRGTDPGPLWQRNYYEHILRTSENLDYSRAYILENPMQWELDQENPDRKTGILPGF